MQGQEEKQKFASIVGATAEAVGAKMSSMGIGVFWEVLKGYPIEDIERAFMSHLTDTESGQFMPKPADIIRQIDGDTNSRALVAWMKVKDAMYSVGYMGSVAFDDPAIHTAIKAVGGWEGINKGQAKDFHFLEARFVKAYRAVSKRIDHPKYLPGQQERENKARGYTNFIPAIRLIGDKEKAKILLAAPRMQGKVAALVGDGK